MIGVQVHVVIHESVDLLLIVRPVAKETASGDVVSKIYK